MGGFSRLAAPAIKRRDHLSAVLCNELPVWEFHSRGEERIGAREKETERAPLLPPRVHTSAALKESCDNSSPSFLEFVAMTWRRSKKVCLDRAQV